MVWRVCVCSSECQWKKNTNINSKDKNVNNTGKDKNVNRTTARTRTWTEQQGQEQEREHHQQGQEHEQQQEAGCQVPIGCALPTDLHPGQERRRPPPARRPAPAAPATRRRQPPATGLQHHRHQCLRQDGSGGARKGSVCVGSEPAARPCVTGQTAVRPRPTSVERAAARTCAGRWSVVGARDVESFCWHRLKPVGAPVPSLRSLFCLSLARNACVHEEVYRTWSSKQANRNTRNNAAAGNCPTHAVSGTGVGGLEYTSAAFRATFASVACSAIV